ncbi:glycosyltransferase [Paenibacillus sp. JX-17]|uniref:Glycosyltransferase n=1 Tax=Paenibacillus lacisoli TaxID=3064525 RepID=A0ABT9CEE3_9BACL|nr:glycosyltransferase [Paenibacillus sp. JX-17]MDO7906999.1 glycosyltransferase [Paenibacillus sp. JX-17]
MRTTAHDSRRAHSRSRRISAGMFSRRRSPSRRAGRRAAPPLLLQSRRQRLLPRHPAAEAVPEVSQALSAGEAVPVSSRRQPLALPLKGTAAAIVTACNEEDQIGGVLTELGRLPLKQVIVVVNGCTDRTAEEVERHPGVTMAYLPDAAGHDVGRALGARMTDADILLFLDGDFAVKAEDLAPFLSAVDSGLDAALNDISRMIPRFAHQDEVTRCKIFLNRSMGRKDLGPNSLTAVPHALSRRFVAEVGAGQLAVPPKAQAIGLQKGLQIQAVHEVDVIKNNRRREINSGRRNPVARMIIGDHAEALAAVMGSSGRKLIHLTMPRDQIARRRNAR